MNTAASYVTHTLVGPIHHLMVDTSLGPIAAPVKLVTDGKRLVTSPIGQAALICGFPRIRDHRFVHALPGGGEVLGAMIGHFEEQRYAKRLADLLEHWNATKHWEGESA